MYAGELTQTVIAAYFVEFDIPRRMSNTTNGKKEREIEENSNFQKDCLHFQLLNGKNSFLDHEATQTKVTVIKNKLNGVAM